jgi:hypothetical protein
MAWRLVADASMVRPHTGAVVAVGEAMIAAEKSAAARIISG